MAWLPLYRGSKHNLKLVAFTVLDDADAETFGEWTWKLKDGRYAVRYSGKGGTSTFRTHRLHREILGLPPKRTSADGREGDHVDGDTLNNRRSNLRVVTHQENMENQRPNRGTSSRYRGVHWNKERRKWHVQVEAAGERHYLGLFDTEQEAADAASDFRLQHMPFTNEDRRIA